MPSWWECADDCGLEPELRREREAVTSEWSEFEAVHLDEGPAVFMKPPQRKALPVDLNSTARRFGSVWSPSGQQDGAADGREHLVGGGRRVALMRAVRLQAWDHVGWLRDLDLSTGYLGP